MNIAYYRHNRHTLRGKEIEAFRGTDIGALRGKDIEILRGTDIEALRGEDIEVLRWVHVGFKNKASMSRKKINNRH